MRGGHQRHELADALTLADIAIVRWHPDLEWDPRDLAPSSDRTTLRVYDHIAEIVDAILTQARPTDQVVLMSNGNFGGLRNKLIDQLSQLH
jgi:UDP-N-acetylmuramate: L-alanyl-gamma-D-glutamyl-meso-diaminopimelate ligase